MNSFTQVMTGHAAFARLLDRLRPWFLLATRLWVSWQFWKSGWLKLTTWDVTLELFRSEYQVPLLPPGVAAVCGTFGELFFPTLLVLGLFTRFGALGLFAEQVGARDEVQAVVGDQRHIGEREYDAADQLHPGAAAVAQVLGEGIDPRMRVDRVAVAHPK